MSLFPQKKWSIPLNRGKIALELIKQKSSKLIKVHCKLFPSLCMVSYLQSYKNNLDSIWQASTQNNADQLICWDRDDNFSSKGKIITQRSSHKKTISGPSQRSVQESHYVNQKRALSTRRDKRTVEGMPKSPLIVSVDATSTSV